MQIAEELLNVNALAQVLELRSHRANAPLQVYGMLILDTNIELITAMSATCL